MLYLAPALVPLAAGLLLAIPVGLTSPERAFQVSKVGLLTTVGISISALLCGFILPREPVANGPVGATCPDASSVLGDLQTVLAVAAVASAAVAVSGAASSAVRRHNSLPASLITVTACFLPYLGVVGWLAPRLCDYS